MQLTCVPPSQCKRYPAYKITLQAAHPLPGNDIL